MTYLPDPYMKVALTLITLMLGISVCPAQTNSRETADFLHALNRLVTGTSQHHWELDLPMKVDSQFHITGDTISITWICDTGDSWTRTRFAAPFSQIKTVDWDHYLVLNYHDDKVVKVYEQTSQSPGWLLKEQTDLLHIAVVADNRKEKKLKKAIENAWLRMQQARK